MGVKYLAGEQLPATSRAAARKFWIDTVKDLKAHPGEVGNIGLWSPGMAYWIRQGAYSYFLPEHPVANRAAYMHRHWDVSTEGLRMVDGKRRADILISWVGAGCICLECA